MVAIGGVEAKTQNYQHRRKGKLENQNARIEEIAVISEQIKRKIDELRQSAFDFARRESPGDRDDAFALSYETDGKETINEIIKVTRELQEIDPDQESRTLWIDLYESEALYHGNLARQVAGFRMQPQPNPSPLAIGKEKKYFEESRKAYKRLIEYAGESGWRWLDDLGEMKWRLGDKDGALQALSEYIENEKDPEKRVETRKLHDEISSSKVANIKSEPVSTTKYVVLAGVIIIAVGFGKCFLGF